MMLKHIHSNLPSTLKRANYMHKTFSGYFEFVAKIKTTHAHVHPTT